jgi:hypothetical protein
VLFQNLGGYQDMRIKLLKIKLISVSACSLLDRPEASGVGGNYNFKKSPITALNFHINKCNTKPL